MRGKNLFKTILIVFVIMWALYTLWPTLKLNMLSQEQKKEMEDAGTMSALMDKAIRMGLDLQGGMYLIYEVDFALLIEQLARSKDDQMMDLIAKSQESMNVSTDDFLTILSQHFQEAGVPLNRYWGEREDSDRKVLSDLNKEARESMTRSLQKLRNRVDQFGVSEPQISPMGDRRILIQLPGITDPDQAKELIGRTALLEFKMLKDPVVFGETIDKIDRALLKIQEGGTADEIADAVVDTTIAAPESRESEDSIVSVSELFGESTEQSSEARQDTSVLVDEQIFKENPFMALLRNTRQYGHEVSVPIENIKTVDRILQREDIQKLVPGDARFLWSSEVFRIGDQAYKELFLVKKEAELTGKYLTDARVTIGSDVRSAGRPEVNFTLNRTGARIFSRVTGANIGKPMAIVLDDRVVSAPHIQDRIRDGHSRITGMRDMDEAKMVSIVLKVGALDAPIHIIEERTVGPSLGKDSITKGSWSALIGMSLIVVFMVIYYRKSGLIADVALILNLVILMAILAQFGFVLTLPGVAGIVLTIGMAVDANVLVFERIREELRTGKTVRASIEAGYSRAFKTILDANVTTLLTALVLYQFGTGPVRGFAVTLSIGVAVSMFTALVVTRYIFDRITARRTLRTLSI